MMLMNPKELVNLSQGKGRLSWQNILAERGFSWVVARTP
jgi:hypothetical protein